VKLPLRHSLLTLPPQAKKKWRDAPETLSARLVSKEVNGNTVQMAYSLKGVEPYQMGFKQSALYLCSHLRLLPGVAPRKRP